MRLTPGAPVKRTPVDDVDLSDLYIGERTGPAAWDWPDLLIPLDPEPTPAEAEAIRRRLVTADAAEEAKLYRLLAAREVLRDVTDARHPVDVIVAAQVDLLDEALARYGC